MLNISSRPSGNAGSSGLEISSTGRTTRTLLFCPPEHREKVFPEAVLDEVARASAEGRVAVVDPVRWRESRELLRTAKVIFATWGMPMMDGDFLEAAPDLRAVFYAGGSVKTFVTDRVWERGIVISSAWEANAIPVAEYSLATILLSLKRFWHFSRAMRYEDPRLQDTPIPGAYRTKVGLVSLGAVGRATVRLLAAFDCRLFAYDPFLSAADANRLGVTLTSLEDLFRECDVISVHAPWLPETEGMIDGKLIASMKEGATLINTARGVVIAEAEMIAVLQERPDLSAVLDVTYPEPPAKDSVLRSLPNVVLTPHIAGSMGLEYTRVGGWLAAELRRYLNGEPLLHSVSRDMLAHMA
ncbi:MAG: hydroxyacid dehydrogenase [Chthoniobacteraceae bacterium]